MTPHDALAFVRVHGVVLASAKGPVPNLADHIAGEVVRGSWWGHRAGKRIFAALSAVEADDDVLACRIVGGKKTFVHARLWAELVRCAARFPREHLARTRERHTAAGKHECEVIAFPDWVPPAVLRSANAMSEDVALQRLGEWAR